MIKLNSSFYIFIVLITIITTSCGSANSTQVDTLANPKIVAGTQQMIWTDHNRIDDYYGGARIINVQVWYPSRQLPNSKVRTPYLLFANQLYQKLPGWSSADWQAMQAVQLSAYVDAPFDPDLTQAPLLIFSPSLGGNLSYYNYYAEYFAAKGYVVMGINHLHESEVVIDQDSTIFLANHRFQDSLKTLKIPEEISADQYREQMGARQKVLAEDIVFALNQLLADAQLGNRIDRNAIAAFGHSVGGAAMIYASMIDPRISAVINFDGTPPSLGLKNGIDVPFLFLEDLTDYRNHPGYAKMHQRRNDFCERSRADAHRILIQGFNHNSYLDLNYYLASNPKTAISEQQNLDQIIGFMDGFLDHYLLENSDLSWPSDLSSRVEILHFDQH